MEAKLTLHEAMVANDRSTVLVGRLQESTKELKAKINHVAWFVWKDREPAASHRKWKLYRCTTTYEIFYHSIQYFIIL